ncbi:MAG: hypothetical protein IJY20_07200 [Clostridia bacterium]|nr:hypothetical protein [Clostridia bacterium]
MKFDPAMMQALLSLDDAALWQKIRQIAAQGGFSISETPPPPAEMAKLRALMQGSGQADVASAMQTLAHYRKKG